MVVLVQAGAASAATAAQYTGAAVMLFMMARKNLLRPGDMGLLPPPKQWADTLKPGVPFAFCIAAVVTALLTATNLATGALCSLRHVLDHVHVGSHSQTWYFTKCWMPFNEIEFIAFEPCGISGRDMVEFHSMVFSSVSISSTFYGDLALDLSSSGDAAFAINRLLTNQCLVCCSSRACGAGSAHDREADCGLCHGHFWHLFHCRAEPGRHVSWQGMCSQLACGVLNRKLM